jgi:hypothetical protein
MKYLASVCPTLSLYHCTHEHYPIDDIAPSGEEDWSFPNSEKMTSNQANKNGGLLLSSKSEKMTSKLANQNVIVVGGWMLTLIAKEGKSTEIVKTEFPVSHKKKSPRHCFCCRYCSQFVSLLERPTTQTKIVTTHLSSLKFAFSCTHYN